MIDLNRILNRYEITVRESIRNSPYILNNALLRNEFIKYFNTNDITFTSTTMYDNIWSYETSDISSTAANISEVLQNLNYTTDEYKFNINDYSTFNDVNYGNLYPHFNWFFIHSYKNNIVYLAEMGWENNNPTIKNTKLISYNRNNPVSIVDKKGELQEIAPNTPTITYNFGGMSQSESYLDFKPAYKWLKGYEEYGFGAAYITYSTSNRYGIEGRDITQLSGGNINLSEHRLITIGVTVSTSYSAKFIIRNPSTDYFYFNLSQVGAVGYIDFIDREIYNSANVNFYNIKEFEENTYLIDLNLTNINTTSLYAQFRGGVTDAFNTTGIDGSYELYGLQLAEAESFIDFGQKNSKINNLTHSLNNTMIDDMVGDNEGSVYFHISNDSPMISGSANLFWFRQTSPVIYFFALYQDSSNGLRIYDYSYNGGTFLIPTSIKNHQFHKIILTWKDNHIKTFLDGELISDIYNLVSYNITEIISMRDNKMDTKFRDMAFGNHLLSDEEGKELTSWNNYENMHKDLNYKIYK